MITAVCQTLILVFWIINLSQQLREKIEGVPAKPPRGVAGVRMLLIASTLAFCIYWAAGAFSNFLKPPS